MNNNESSLNYCYNRVGLVKGNKIYVTLGPAGCAEQDQGIANKFSKSKNSFWH